VKRSGRDEPGWVVMYICMETTQGFSLYSHLYLRLAKMSCFSYYLLCLLFYKIGEQEDRTWKGESGGRRGGDGCAGEEVAQIIYTHVSKCKNDKIT
jgi:hypothetical protein